MIAIDNSNSGLGSDTFDVTLSNGFHARGALKQGNIKIIDLTSVDKDIEENSP